ncbi:MAG: DUF4111 domain-containing protein [Micromonosporaceae bacterium]|nr:DUF4111 domain-containing protein [Micromonosporaceae bacterium]
MIRISPGEPLHLTQATRHYLLSWVAARDRGRAVRGTQPGEVIPAIEPDQVRQVVVDHLRQWPALVHEMTSAGAQAYSVLTLCRAVHLVVEGNQVSKLATARYAATALPEWTDLITWTRQWWYEGGSDSGPGYP